MKIICRKCNICDADVQRASYAKHLRSKNHLAKKKQNGLIIPEWLFKKPIENRILKVYNPKTLTRIAGENFKLDDEQLKKN